MATWILILTLSPYASAGGVAVSSVPGFMTHNACEIARSAWLETKHPARTNKSAVCVKTY